MIKSSNLKILSKNKYITLKIHKKIGLLSLALACAIALIFSSLRSINALTNQPQPSGTDFKWVSVDASTTRVNLVKDVSYDGRYVMFSSYSPLFVEGDTNGAQDIFIKDMQTSTVQRINVANDGSQLNGAEGATMSPNAQYVAFTQVVSSHAQIYIRDRTSNITALVSSDASGTMGNGDSNALAVSDSGKLLFSSSSTNLVNGITSGSHIYQKNISSGTISELPFIDPTGNSHNWAVNTDYALISNDGNTAVVQAFDSTTNFRTASNAAIEQIVAIDLVNNTSSLVTPNSVSSAPTQATYYLIMANGGISRNGQYVLFISSDHHLMSSSIDATLYRKDLQTGTITAVDNTPNSVTSNGNAYSGSVTRISDDGRYVGFGSSATNLDANYSPTRVTDNGGFVIGGSLYIRDMVAGTPQMKVNQTTRANSMAYAPGSGKFIFSTSESIDNADPNGIDVYTTQ